MVLLWLTRASGTGLSCLSSHDGRPGINSFLFISLVLVCLLLGGLIKRYNFHYLPESGASMLFGLICGFILNLSQQERGRGRHQLERRDMLL